MGGTLTIWVNASLADIDGLANLTSVGEWLYIRANSKLENCSALASLLGWPDGPPNDNIGGDITVINESTTEVTYTGVAAGSFLQVSVLSVVALSGGPTTADVLALF